MTNETVERYCEIMHDAYEQAAVGAGWETQAASRKPWDEVPEANKATMRAAVSAVVEVVLSDVSRTLDVAQREVIREIGREAGSRMAGLEQAQFAILRIRDEIRR